MPFPIGGPLLDRLVRRTHPAAEAPGRQRLFTESSPELIYAIGDVHGRLDLLRSLESKIVDDAAALAQPAWLVMLGDYVDRGPQSAQVIDHLLAPPPPGFARYCLAGNHELAMLDFLGHPRANHAWLEFGGDETLRSYGIEAAPGRCSPRQLAQSIESHIPAAHRHFLATLPMLLATPDFIFVHAGLRPGIAIEAQNDSDLSGIRDGFGQSYEEFERRIVHGHMPLAKPFEAPFRIGVDTGAYATGRLTAVRLRPNAPATFLSSAS
jgi:serine/threonine protein phosphatase 1